MNLREHRLGDRRFKGSRVLYQKQGVLMRIAMMAALCMLILTVDLFAADTRAVNMEPDSVARGLSFYHAGDNDRALAVLLDFIEENPHDSRVPEVALVLARIYNAKGRYSDVLNFVEKIPADQRGREVDLLKGLSEIKVGRVEEGIKLLRALDETVLPIADRGQRLEALADGYRYLDQRLEALLFFYRALMLTSPSGTADHILEQTGDLAGQLSDPELAEAAFLFDGSPIGQQAGLEKARRFFRAGNSEKALSQVEAVLRHPVNFPDRDQAVQLRERLAGSIVPNRSLGVILPLSGRYATFGKQVRRGMELAVQDQRGESSAVRLIFKDSTADAAQSARLVSELANVDQVMGIIGPLTGAAAEAAADRAEMEKVPLLALSQHKGLAEKGPFVFRVSLTSELQAKALVQHAMVERGLSSFAILGPANRSGREFSEAFASEVEKRGGRIVARQFYPAEATDFRRQIKLLKGENPDAPFEALFIPDYAERVGLIAPQLPFYGLRGLPLLGINGWNSPELLLRAGDYVEDAVFADGFFSHSDYPFVKEFVNRCFEQFGEEPTILEAQGYDAAGIMLSFASQENTRTREELRRALSRLQNYPGVTGATSFDLEGDAQKVLFLLQVQDGKIVQIN